MDFFRNCKEEKGLHKSFLFFTFLVGLIPVFGCSILATRPIQEMSNTTAAIRAAKEVQADTLAPELYRQSNEWFFKAKREYKFKNFKLAKEYANKARYLAEQAEFEALRNGGTRAEPEISDPMANPAPASSPYPYPTPEGTPAEYYQQKKAEEEAKEAKKKADEQAQQAPPSPLPPKE